MNNTHGIEHVVIIGPGALGRVLAVRLAAAAGGPRVTLIDHRPDRAARLNARPLRLHAAEGDLEARVAVRTAPEAPPDLVLLATKAHAAAEAVRQAASWIGRTPVVTLQNGLGVAAEVAAVLPQAEVVTAVTYQAANVAAEDEVRHVDNGLIRIGREAAPPAGPDAGAPLLEAVAHVLRLIGCPVRVEPDIRSAVWGKLLINAALNPVAALAGEPNGRVAERPALRALACVLAEEGEAVARAAGIALPYPSAAEATLRTARRTADNRCSMLQDLDAGRPTEIEYLSGALIRAAERHGLAVPTHRALAALVRQVSPKKP
jgi:2-dehydropantoate 2-reductase